MTAVNHALTGAVIAVAVQRPLLAIPLAFVSHFALDGLPHFGIPIEGKSSADAVARNRKPFYRLILRFDLLLTVVLLISLGVILHGQALVYLVLVCSVVAISPDFVWLYLFLKQMKAGKLLPYGWFSRFHKWIQWSEKPWGLGVEAVWLGLAVAALAILL
ncbi:MAG: hypothetical protein ACREGF_03465 [Candidatus Saccharimonadales bacterium]